MLKEYLSNIANALRQSLGISDKIGAQDFANKIGEVYEAGQQAEYDRFWNAFQNNGNRTIYSYAFYGTQGWKYATFNPKYPIRIVNAEYMLYNSQITQIPVDIVLAEDASLTPNARVFYNCTQLKTIKKIVMVEHVNASSWFYNCKALENITFEGVIGKNIDFSYSPLTSQSMLSVIEHLKDYSNDGGTFTVTFKADRETMLTDEQKAVATNKGWSLVWN